MEKPYLLCIGHRGAMGHEPENTLSSVRKALQMGVRCIEIDVYYVEGQLVVFHDDRLERTTNGHGLLCEQSFAYLRTLDAGHGQKIPTLAEVCEVIQARACINIELKGPHTAEPVARLISRLIENGWDIEKFLLSSFNYAELRKIKPLLPAIKLGVLIEGRPVDSFKITEELGAFSVNPAVQYVNQQFVDDAHARNLKVFVYTVDNIEDISRMYHLGVDGVFTGFPEKVIENYSQLDPAKDW